jgi:hypothetical protein
MTPNIELAPIAAALVRARCSFLFLLRVTSNPLGKRDEARHRRARHFDRR